MMQTNSALRSAGAALLALISGTTALTQARPQTQPQTKRHNVIIFVADGLRRGSVTAEAMPTFLKVRTEGVDFRDSHSVFPTFTTANASAIATGHGLGDTGDYSNVIYPGVWLTKPDPQAANGTIAPFLESDPILANMNSVFGGNYLGETPLLSAARAKGFNVASIGKIGPTAIQQVDAVRWNEQGLLSTGDAVIVDDTTGTADGLPLPEEIADGIAKAGLPLGAPTRTNGYPDASQWSNGFSGDAATAGTLVSNQVQQQWMTDVTTRVLLPKFAADSKPFVLLFWSRDPDATQHNEGDSLQRLDPGINGETATAGLKNADHSLKALLDWLDAHPEVKANTDVLLTSDHGFATITRRELGPDAQTAEPSALMTYDMPGEKPEPPGTLPTGFLAVDLGIRGGMRVFDPAKRAAKGASAYEEVRLGGVASEHPSGGSALLGETVQRVDGQDAKLILEANGGSDLIYVPSGDASLVHQTLDTLAGLDYVGGVFVDDKYCAKASDSKASQCGGALPMSAVGLVGKSKVPRPAIVVTFKVWYPRPGDLQSAAQISDTTLQEGQGMHGGFGREQTLNNMAAIGPDFKKNFVDETPFGNIDLAPTIASILGIELPSAGSLKGRVAREAMAGQSTAAAGAVKRLVSEPTSSGTVTVLEYEEADGVRYYDRACLVPKGAAQTCP